MLCILPNFQFFIIFLPAKGIDFYRDQKPMFIQIVWEQKFVIRARSLEMPHLLDINCLRIYLMDKHEITVHIPADFVYDISQGVSHVLREDSAKFEVVHVN